MQQEIKTDVSAYCNPLLCYVSEWEYVYSTGVSQMIPHSATDKAGSSWAAEAANVAPFLVGTLVSIGVNEIQCTAIGFLNPGPGCGLVHTYMHMYTDQEEIAFCNEELTAILHIQAPHKCMIVGSYVG